VQVGQALCVAELSGPVVDVELSFLGLLCTIRREGGHGAVEWGSVVASIRVEQTGIIIFLSKLSGCPVWEARRERRRKRVRVKGGRGSREEREGGATQKKWSLRVRVKKGTRIGRQQEEQVSKAP
jgi:hypothetical protein